MVTMSVACPCAASWTSQHLETENAGDPPGDVLRPVGGTERARRDRDMAVFESGVRAHAGPGRHEPFERTGSSSLDLYLAIVPQDSYLYKAGLGRGQILRLDEEPVPLGPRFASESWRRPTAARLDYQAARDGRVRTAISKFDAKISLTSTARRFSLHHPMQHWIPLAPEERVEHPARFRYALEKAVDETIDVTRFTLVSIVRLLQGRLSWKSLSGPITIYEVAGEEGRKGADFFVWVMALLSINLGL